MNTRLTVNTCGKAIERSSLSPLRGALFLCPLLEQIVNILEVVPSGTNRRQVPMMQGGTNGGW